MKDPKDVATETVPGFEVIENPSSPTREQVKRGFEKLLDDLRRTEVRQRRAYEETMQKRQALEHNLKEM